MHPSPFFRIACAAALTLSLSACFSMRSYIDPGLHTLTWKDLRAPASPHAITPQVEFSVNGKRNARGESVARRSVYRALMKSGVFSVPAINAPLNPAAAVLAVKIDNVANVAEAGLKGFGTGLTLGANGTSVTDAYRITIVYRQGDTTIEKQYEHALHTTLGNEKAPVNMPAVNTAQAFEMVIEDAVMHFIRDMQGEGRLVRNDKPGPLRQG